MDEKEKAIAYDKAIERAKDCLKDGTITSTAIGYIETIFPELRESEDEKIRKELIFYLGDMPEDTELRNGVTNRDVLVWLEKQKDINALIQEASEKAYTEGMRVERKHWLEKQESNLVENGHTDNKDFIRYADNYSHEIWHKLMDNFKNIKDYHIGCNDVSDIVLNAIIDTCNWLEKQGQTFTKKDVDDAYLKGVSDAKHELEKQGEQQPADKVEPRFKVKYAGSEYNVLEVKDIAGVIFYGIEDEPNHIDYVQAANCERVDGYNIKENGSPFPIKPAKFSKEKPAWSEEDSKMFNTCCDFLTVEECAWLKSLKERLGGK